ncbi:hypothetical protein D9M68_731100 [compost metagenome]
MKLAGLLRVAARMQALATPGPVIEGPAIKAGDSLRQALSLMLWQRCTSLPVVDEQGVQVGVLHLDALLREAPR